jgi:hypothetical protein
MSEVKVLQNDFSWTAMNCSQAFARLCWIALRPPAWNETPGRGRQHLSLSIPPCKAIEQDD